MGSPKDVFVAGNPLVTRRGDTYGGGRKCDDTVCGVPAEPQGFTSPEDRELVVVNPQTAAISAVFSLIQRQVQASLKTKLRDNALANTVIADDHAIPDIAKRGTVDPRFIRRFQSSSGRSIDDTGDLLTDISTELQTIKENIALTLQLDQSGSLHHYFTENAEAQIGELLKANALVYDARDEQKTVENIKELIERFGWREPTTPEELKLCIKTLRLISFKDDKPMARTRVKPALAGAAGRFVPLPLSLFRPEVTGLIANHLDRSIFNISDVCVEPERVLRDIMPIEALRLGWDDVDDVNFDSNGQPYHPVKNAFVISPRGHWETKCLGVVAGTFVRLASRYPGAAVHYLMEED